MEIAFDNEGKWDRWFGKLSEQDQDAVALALDLLETLGHALPMPHAKPLGGGLHELRIHAPNTQYRIFYAIETDTARILSHVKKTSPEAAKKAQDAARKKL